MLTRDKIKGFLSEPSRTFKAVKEEDVRYAIRYYFSLLIVYVVIVSCIYLFFAFLKEPIWSFLYMINMIIFGMLFLFLGAAWIHLWIRVFGRRGCEKTLKAVAYARTPSLLFGWIEAIPFSVSLFTHSILQGMLSIFFIIWNLFLLLIGIKEIHDFSTRRAAMAILLSILPLFIIVTLIILLWLKDFHFLIEVPQH
jgi:hypothetical protein